MMPLKRQWEAVDAPDVEAYWRLVLDGRGYIPCPLCLGLPMDTALDLGPVIREQSAWRAEMDELEGALAARAAERERLAALREAGQLDLFRRPRRKRGERAREGGTPGYTPGGIGSSTTGGGGRGRERPVFRSHRTRH